MGRIKKKTAILNTSSLRKYEDLTKRLEEKVGEIEFVNVDKDIDALSLAKRLESFHYIIAGTTPKLSAQFLEATNNLEYITRQGIGYNNVDVKVAKDLGIKVSNVPAVVEKEDVAEHALALLMTLSKRVNVAHQAVKDLQWSIDRERFFGMRIHKKKVGILGYGNIGRTFSRIMKYGFECEILAYDPYMSEEQISQFGGRKTSLDNLLRESDVISIHINLTQETTHLLDEEKIKMMKKGAILINTARGELVDELAITKYLNKGHLGGYGCDVIENEPIKEDHPLLSARNVLITPHIAVYNCECNYQMSEAVVNDVIAVYENREPMNLLTK